MCETGKFITLSESKESQITWCKGCKNFSLSYKCCCASFTEREINQFNKLLNTLGKAEYNREFSGQPQAVLTTPKSHIGFCLTEQDTDILKRVLSEALSVYQAFKIIYC